MTHHDENLITVTSSELGAQLVSLNEGLQPLPVAVETADGFLPIEKAETRQFGEKSILVIRTGKPTFQTI